MKVDTGRFCTDVMGRKVEYRTSGALFVDRSSQVTTAAATNP